MTIKNDSQIQIRVDAKTKKEAQKIFDNLGLDMSSAIKLFFHQTINSKNLPFEIRDENGFTLHNAEILRHSIVDAKNSPKSFKSGSALLKDALSD
ncbi:MAG: type II toxin-antitoxin system RelB/DinJ family antitoxin [Candidatus Pacebacteria bacterium]|nr:type II toxin-antitoxin system RelB/DinJ family antitoxin [Candidatus Paceibacterota bacterium]